MKAQIRGHNSLIGYPDKYFSDFSTKIYQYIASVAQLDIFLISQQKYINTSASVAQLDARPINDQEVASLIKPGR